MNFTLPPGLSRDSARELRRACVAGGPDNFPVPTEVTVGVDQLLVRRAVDESGCLVVPWHIPAAGCLMGSTGTLIERSQPYQLVVELARGKVNQLRSQLADWQANGLQVLPELAQCVREASLMFGKAVTLPPSEAACEKAAVALALAYRGAEDLVRLYTEQMFQARHLRQPRLDTVWGCRLGPAALQSTQGASLVQACNSICLALAWNDVEPAEGKYRWEPYDALLDWAQAHNLVVSAGPLIDFSPDRLPDWLWLWERDPSSIANFMCDYIETAVKRYADRIQSWQLTAASNCAAVLGLDEEELLWLTARLAEVARHIQAKADLFVGISQPWGEYMALEDHIHSPLIFADTLIRSGLNLAGLDVELVMGVQQRGSYCRDLLETSRLLDLYSSLGVPLRVTLGFPSADEPDPRAHPDWGVHAGHWKGGFSPDVQAHWMAAYAALILCKPFVRGVHWVHVTDAELHQFPHGGLFDAQDKPKPAFGEWRKLRENHLR